MQAAPLTSEKELQHYLFSDDGRDLDCAHFA